ncbi:hypothetical protein [Lichenibacterium dinghuense]|uniref:hypothetical protein n=1 Tax=Lichenibacterium dinghuense TaxID=2895977 RepID=UPI001F48B0BA|nr:hypothetical protein [Lichenibacterium sp. 6Y81]
MADVVRLPIRERVAVLTYPAEHEWQVTTYEVGLGRVLLQRTFHNPHHACDLLTVLGRDGAHRIVIEPEAERWRHLMHYSRHDKAEARL